MLHLLEFQAKGRAGDGMSCSRSAFGGGSSSGAPGNLAGTTPFTFHPGKSSESLPDLLSFPVCFGRSPYKRLMVELDAPQNLSGFCRFPPRMETLGFFRRLSLPLVHARGSCSLSAGIHPIPSFFQEPSFDPILLPLNRARLFSRNGNPWIFGDVDNNS